MPGDQPNWRGTSLDSPITKVVIPLTAVKDDIGYPGGTGFIIAPFLALTARHVTDAMFTKFEGGARDGDVGGTFEICTYVVAAPGHAIPLFVRRVWTSARSDLAVLWLAPGAEMDPGRIWDTP